MPPPAGAAAMAMLIQLMVVLTFCGCPIAPTFVQPVPDLTLTRLVPSMGTWALAIFRVVNDEIVKASSFCIIS